jgi:hypothetical protein
MSNPVPSIEQALRDIIDMLRIKPGECRIPSLKELEPWKARAEAALSAAPAEPVGIVCHASGDRCLGCPHYHGKAATCTYAVEPVGMEAIEEAIETYADALLGAAEFNFDGQDASKEHAALISLIRNAIRHDAKDGERLEHVYSSVDAVDFIRMKDKCRSSDDFRAQIDAALNAAEEGKTNG